MPPQLFHIVRAVLVACVGAIATVIISTFDRHHCHDPDDDFDQ